MNMYAYTYMHICICHIHALIYTYRVMVSTLWSGIIYKGKIKVVSGRDGRVVHGSGLENRYSYKKTIEGSNPSLSFCSSNNSTYQSGPVPKKGIAQPNISELQESSWRGSL
jgi:hypothetical protein|eukprot:Gb_03041 [translate_table: standard]